MKKNTNSREKDKKRVYAKKKAKKEKNRFTRKKKRILYNEWANNLVPRALFPSNI